MNMDKCSVWVYSKMLVLGCYNIQELADKLGFSYATVRAWINGTDDKKFYPRYSSIVKLKKMFLDDDWDWLLS